MFIIIDFKRGIKALKGNIPSFCIIGDIGAYYCDELLHPIKGREDERIVSVICSYQRFGISCFANICNDRGVIIIDFKNNKLFLVADKIGHQTFYYAANSHELIISSDIKQLAGAIGARISRDAFWFYLQGDFIPGNLTIFSAVYKVPPASFLSLDNGVICLSKYSAFILTGNEKNGEAIEVQIEKKLKSFLGHFYNNKVGVMLSGGFDSTLLCKLALQELGSIDTFTIRMDYFNIAIANKAKIISKILKTNHTEIILTIKDYIKCFPLAIALMNEPVFEMDIPAIYYMISSLSQRKIKFFLHGFGCDEIFGNRQYDLRLKNSIIACCMLQRRADFSIKSWKIYKFIRAKVPQELLLHNGICFPWGKRILFPFLEYSMVNIGLGLSGKLRADKAVLGRIDPKLSRIFSFHQKCEPLEQLPLQLKEITKELYLNKIRNSQVLKELLRRDELSKIIDARNADKALKLIIFQLWFESFSKGS